MTYNELQDLCESKKTTLKSIYVALGMTRTGFQGAIENQSLPIKRLLPLCNKLGITPNEFFGVDSVSNVSANGTAVQLGGQANTLNYAEQSETIAMLREQIRTKDEQISSLLQLLSKG